MADADVPSSSSAFPSRTLPQATFIHPDTGERVNTKFTLRDPKVFGKRVKQSGQAPKSRSNSTTLKQPPASWHERWFTRLRRGIQHLGQLVWHLFTSREGQGVLRCTLAHFLATLAVFVPPISNLLGVTPSKHLVAVFVLWFHPFRAVGNMGYGVLLILVALIYGACIAYLSMGVVALFASHGMISVGHAIILVVFCGGGLGSIAWIKQRYNDILVAVSCALAAIPIATVLIKDPAVRDGQLSHNTVSRVFRMMIMALVITLLVNVLVRPISAILDLRENLAKATSAYADILAGVTASFLTGTEDDINHPAVEDASKRFNAAFDTLDQNLADSKFEHYLKGTENQYWIEKRLVEGIKRLRQDIGGLRSATHIQFALLAEGADKAAATDPASREVLDESMRTVREDAASRNAAINDAIDDSMSDADSDMSTVIGGMEFFFSPRPNRPSISLSKPHGPSVASSGHIFATFIEHLGPHLKSLAFTLNHILKDLPLDRETGFAGSLHPNFRPSLSSAIELFEKSRKEALTLVYQSKAVTQSRFMNVAADFEDVAASCGHFSSSLQDLAEGCLMYLDTVNELEIQVNSRGKSWNWLYFWRRGAVRLPEDHEAHRDATPRPQSQEVEYSLNMSSVATRRYKAAARAQDKLAFNQTFRYRIWRSLHAFRRDDTKFAIKVGVGAILLAMWAYIPATQPTFSTWRMEWALLTYMFACALTVGAANSGVLWRVQGTIIGAILALLVWVVAKGNPFALTFLCWLVSLWAFYKMIVLNQGVMSGFTLLTFDLSVLYSYSLSVGDQDDEANGGFDLQIAYVVGHRVVAVIAGILWALIVTQAVQPTSARRKLKTGLSLLWLRMALIWKRTPLSVLEDHETSGAATPIPKYMNIREEQKLRDFAVLLDKFRVAAESEFVLRGPFDSASYDELLKATGRMLDEFHSLNVLLAKDLKASPGEKVILQYTRSERQELSRRISHLFSVLASSIKLQYPLSDTLPEIEHTRDRLLAKVFKFRTQKMMREGGGTVEAEAEAAAVSSSDAGRSMAASKVAEAMPTDQDFEILYAYALVTKQIAKEIAVCSRALEKLYGVLSEDVLKLQ